MTNTIRLAGVIVVLCVAVLIAGCGGGSDSSEPALTPVALAPFNQWFSLPKGSDVSDPPPPTIGPSFKSYGILFNIPTSTNARTLIEGQANKAGFTYVKTNCVSDWGDCTKGGGTTTLSYTKDKMQISISFVVLPCPKDMRCTDPEKTLVTVSIMEPL